MAKIDGFVVDKLMKTLFRFGNVFMHKHTFVSVGKLVILEYYDEEKAKAEKHNRPFKWKREIKVRVYENGYILELGR